jgi:uncharacterized membrane protein YeaQ/YmgE (transglycosylase-associated protein family)
MTGFLNALTSFGNITLVIITALVAAVVHLGIYRYKLVEIFVRMGIPRFGIAMFVGAVAGLIVTKLVQSAYFGFLGSMWILSIPGEFVVAYVVSCLVGLPFMLAKRKLEKEAKRG